MIVCWEGKINPGLSRAVVSQVDFLATFAALTNQTLLPSQAIDSYNMLSSLQGLNKKGRDHVVFLSLNNTRSLVKDGWNLFRHQKVRK
jgi:arylsulfatase A-like enzyme